MRHHLLSLICIICMLSITSCKRNVLRGEGNKTSVNPTVTMFDGVDVGIPVKVEVNVQPVATPGIQLSGYENIIKHITTKVKDNVLIISTDLDETWDIDCDGVVVQVTMPVIAGLALTGSPDAEVHGNVTGPSFDVEVSGAGNIVMDSVNADTFSITVSGAGKFVINGGNVKFADYEISGAGELFAFPLITAETDIIISGAGEGEVTAQQKLDAHIGGAGTIKYKGHPAITQDVSGAGTVKDAN